MDVPFVVFPYESCAVLCTIRKMSGSESNILPQTVIGYDIAKFESPTESVVPKGVNCVYKELFHVRFSCCVNILLYDKSRTGIQGLL